MSSSTSDFRHTTILRIKAIICLAIANLFLIHDGWAIFFILVFLAIICEILHRRLSEILLHNHKVTEHNRKIEQSKAS